MRCCSFSMHPAEWRHRHELNADLPIPHYFCLRLAFSGSVRVLGYLVAVGYFFKRII
uniref:Uncharacterized protein n=1 Tax=Ralstonia solanacearum TaxID=305 RepID=A0A0S4U6S3_RALSL|nr:protein of unknown function [Ralstonia solanacearum]